MLDDPTGVTPAVRTAVRKRNQLRRVVQTKRKEWLDACNEVRRLIEDSKRKAWEDFLLEAEYSVDPSEMWRVIRSLSGDPTSLAPNEA